MARLTGMLREHQRIGLDTSVFIYHIEGSTQFAEPAGAVLDALAGGRFEGVTSIVTLMEISVKPLQVGRPEVADEYEIVLASYPHLILADVDRTIARRAAELRAKYRLRPADALQVATCLKYGATAFLTNDKDLLRVDEVQILLLADFGEP